MKYIDSLPCHTLKVNTFNNKIISVAYFLGPLLNFIPLETEFLFPSTEGIIIFTLFSEILFKIDPFFKLGELAFKLIDSIIK